MGTITTNFIDLEMWGRERKLNEDDIKALLRSRCMRQEGEKLKNEGRWYFREDLKDKCEAWVRDRRIRRNGVAVEEGDLDTVLPPLVGNHDRRNQTTTETTIRTGPTPGSEQWFQQNLIIPVRTQLNAFTAAVNTRLGTLEAVVNDNRLGLQQHLDTKMLEDRTSVESKIDASKVHLDAKITQTVQKNENETGTKIFHIEAHLMQAITEIQKARDPSMLTFTEQEKQTSLREVTMWIPVHMSEALHRAYSMEGDFKEADWLDLRYKVFGIDKKQSCNLSGSDYRSVAFFKNALEQHRENRNDPIPPETLFHIVKCFQTWWAEQGSGLATPLHAVVEELERIQPNMPEVNQRPTPFRKGAGRPSTKRKREPKEVDETQPFDPNARCNDMLKTPALPKK